MLALPKRSGGGGIRAASAFNAATVGSNASQSPGATPFWPMTPRSSNTMYEFPRLTAYRAPESAPTGGIQVGEAPAGMGIAALPSFMVGPGCAGTIAIAAFGLGQVSDTADSILGGAGVRLGGGGSSPVASSRATRVVPTAVAMIAAMPRLHCGKRRTLFLRRMTSPLLTSYLSSSCRTNDMLLCQGRSVVGISLSLSPPYSSRLPCSHRGMCA